MKVRWELDTKVKVWQVRPLRVIKIQKLENLKTSYFSNNKLTKIFNELPILTGIVHVFIKHTSASLTINENADPSVREDFETHFNKLVPENSPDFIHSAEGPDDMPAHIKSALLGSTLSVPIKDGRMNLGTWQDIYLCEHRNHAPKRTLVLTLNGQKIQN